MSRMNLSKFPLWNKILDYLPPKQLMKMCRCNHFIMEAVLNNVNHQKFQKDMGKTESSFLTSDFQESEEEEFEEEEDISDKQYLFKNTISLKKFTMIQEEDQEMLDSEENDQKLLNRKKQGKKVTPSSQGSPEIRIIPDTMNDLENKVKGTSFEDYYKIEVTKSSDSLKNQEQAWSQQEQSPQIETKPPLIKILPEQQNNYSSLLSPKLNSEVSSQNNPKDIKFIINTPSQIFLRQDIPVQSNMSREYQKFQKHWKRKNEYFNNLAQNISQKYNTQPNSPISIKSVVLPEIKKSESQNPTGDLIQELIDKQEEHSAEVISNHTKLLKRHGVYYDRNDPMHEPGVYQHKQRLYE